MQESPNLLRHVQLHKKFLDASGFTREMDSKRNQTIQWLMFYRTSGTAPDTLS